MHDRKIASAPGTKAPAASWLDLVGRNVGDPGLELEVRERHRLEARFAEEVGEPLPERRDVRRAEPDPPDAERPQRIEQRAAGRDGRRTAALRLDRRPQLALGGQPIDERARRARERDRVGLDLDQRLGRVGGLARLRDRARQLDPDRARSAAACG